MRTLLIFRARNSIPLCFILPHFWSFVIASGGQFLMAKVLCTGVTFISFSTRRGMLSLPEWLLSKAGEMKFACETLEGPEIVVRNEVSEFSTNERLIRKREMGNMGWREGICSYLITVLSSTIIYNHTWGRCGIASLALFIFLIFCVLYCWQLQDSDRKNECFIGSNILWELIVFARRKRIRGKFGIKRWERRENSQTCTGFCDFQIRTVAYYDTRLLQLRWRFA